jgi:hypothetical protein
MKLRALLFVCASALVAVSCANKGKRAGTRDTGQSRLMSQTFAGQNACNPDNHLRPFIIEWDATDMSSFESYAANDIVIVRYEGCTLTVLDECRNDSIRGSQGSYRPPEWTSGSLEKIGITNEAELVAKLPLGAATLGTRVSGGESFHMEYFVAGTRNATRDSVYLSDIANNPGCQGATHFVYGYNLGAFALASANNLQTEVGGSYFGFSAEGKAASDYSADKRGGDLTVCRSDSATEVSGCKAPIRLTLRPIREGDNPENTMLTAAETPEAASLAAQMKIESELNKQAAEMMSSARVKMNANDGKGCLKELDAAAKLDPKADSQDPKSGMAILRSQCLMVSGQCDAGKQLARKWYENSMGQNFGPEQIDSAVEGLGRMHCQGKMSDRDALLKASMDLMHGAHMSKKDVKFCEAAHKRIVALRDKVKPKDGLDNEIITLRDRPDNTEFTLATCLGRAGDCKRARKVYDGVMAKNFATIEDAAQKEQMLQNGFESMVQICKQM